MLRRFVSLVLLLAVAAALLVVALPQLFGLQRNLYFTQVIAFRGVLVLCGLVLFVIVVLLAILLRPVRRFFGWFAVLALAFSLVNAGVLFERGTTDERAAKAGGDVRVLAWNTEGGRPGAARIAALALSKHADIVSLPETSLAIARQVAASLKAKGVTMQVFNLTYDTYDLSHSTSLLVSSKLGKYTQSSDKQTTEILPTVVVSPAGTADGPVIVGAHPVSPITSHMAPWHTGLDYLQRVCSGSDVIMAGDFNSTLDHLSGLGARTATLGNCFDSADTRAGGLGTWPSNVPVLLAAPIDHVMATNDWRTTGFEVITSEDKTGSDHRPVLAQLTPRGSN